MISGIQSSSAAAANSTYTAQAGQSAASSGAVAIPDPTDIVTLSPAARAKLLAQVMLPNYENIQKSAAALTDSLNAKLSAAGISASPPFSLSIKDPNQAHVTVTGDRPDAKKIEDLINGDKSLQLQVHNTEALASQYSALAGPAKFSRAYTAASTPAEVSAALSKYGYLFGGNAKGAAIALNFDGSSFQVDANGKPITPNIVDMPG
jgi:hypothetical protein